MPITSVKYTDKQNVVEIVMDDGSVWIDNLTLPPDNVIRKELHEWLDVPENGIEEFVAPAAPVPTDVGKLYFIRALRQLNLKTLFTTIMDGASTEIKEDYDLTTRIVRSDPMTVAFEQVAATQGVTSEQVDNIFITAHNMEVDNA